MKNFLQHFGTLLLISLLLIKSSAFHVYEHEETSDDSNHCELCVLTLDSQQAEVLVPAVAIANETPVYKELSLNEDFESINYKNSDNWSTLLSRPPPHL
ncbi:hypothetical protein [Spongiimicrobium salis]|uniref:hypothetical protein n=1 Tax=Spongiimicrobium salis TaxID=1667022 RepID=UPI00374CB55D